MADECSSCLGRQLAEVEVIRAMYPGEGEFQTTEAEAMALEMLDSLKAEETDSGSRPPNGYPVISFTLHLLATKLGGRHVSICFSFPRRYPEAKAARVTVECGGHVTKHQHETISLGAQAAADEMAGSESVLQVVQRTQEIAWEMEGENPAHNSATSAGQDGDGVVPSCHSPKPSPSSSSSVTIHRKLLWFHHIKSQQKRKHILEWGSELQLGGYCKPGFPGVLIFEGEGKDAAEYVRRIQRLRWQAVQIRGEEEEEVVAVVSKKKVDGAVARQGGREDSDGDGDGGLNAARRFPLGIVELLESGMSDLAGKCREANLEHLFLSALKISR